MRSYWEPSTEQVDGVADTDNLVLDDNGNRQTDTASSVTPTGERTPLPRGSTVFQEVLCEILKENEAERQKLLDITEMMKPKKEVIKQDGDKSYRHAGLWKLASVKVMKRTPSQKSDLGLKWNLKT